MLMGESGFVCVIGRFALRCMRFSLSSPNRLLQFGNLKRNFGSKSVNPLAIHWRVSVERSLQPRVQPNPQTALRRAEKSTTTGATFPPFCTLKMADGPQKGIFRSGL